MNITRSSLDEAASRGILSAAQGQALWAFLTERERDTPSFKPAHILYYLGGMMAIGAMSLFMTLGWERFGGKGLLLIALVYAAVALALTEHLLHSRHLPLPAGITAALAVTLVPLAVYGGQHTMGLWPDDQALQQGYRSYHTHIDWRWLMMELATLAAAAVALWRYRLPFLLLPLAVTLWYMSMDLVPFLLGADGSTFFSKEGKRISTAFGLAMVLLALWVDLRTRNERDFAFWLHVFGVITFWGGLTSMDSHSEVGKFIYACINVGLIAVGAALSRRVYAAFGGLGLAMYLGHLSYRVFANSMGFPVALTAIGLTVIAAGIAWQRHEDTLGARLRALLPKGLRELVERRSGR